MKTGHIFLLSLLLLTSPLFAQEVVVEDCLEPTVMKSETHENVMQLKQTVDSTVVKSYVVEDKKKDRWVLTFRFGPTANWYPRTDYKFKSGDSDFTMKNVKFVQRPSMSYYKVWDINGEDHSNPFQFVDEPTNQFILEAKKGRKLVLGARVVHPKMVIRSAYDVN